MKRLFNLKSEFFGNVLTLMTGTTMAQIIVVAVSPVLTRLYSPQDFGLLALFTALTAVIGMAATGRYELAIVLPKEEQSVANLTALSILLAIVTSLLTLLLIFFFNEPVTRLLNSPQMAGYLYLVPPAVFLLGMFNSFNYYFTSKKDFKKIAGARVGRQLSGTLFQLIWGFFRASALGLIGGRMVFHAVGNLVFLWRFPVKRQLSAHVTRGGIKRMARRYRDFPLYSLPAQVSNTLSAQINSIFISSLFSTAILGFYGLVNRVLNLPLAMISTSVGQVFLEQASTERKRSGNARRAYRRLLLRLILISVLIFVPLYFVIEPMFGLVFGEQWITAGQYAQILIPLFAVRFVASPLSMINIVFEKQRAGMVWQITLLVLTILVFTTTKALHLEVEQFLQVLTLVLGVHYIILIGITYRFSRGDAGRK